MPKAARGARRGQRRRGRPAGRGFAPLNVDLGDRIRVERRFVVDGVLTSVADQGVFHGVQAMGSVEHILLESKGEVRLIPLPTVSEIVLEDLGEKRHSPGAGQAYDPGIV